MTTMSNAPKSKVEDKLYNNRYVVDPGKPHIRVKPHDVPSEALLALTHVCPANCFALRATTSNGAIRAAASACCSSSARHHGPLDATEPRPTSMGVAQM